MMQTLIDTSRDTYWHCWSTQLTLPKYSLSMHSSIHFSTSSRLCSSFLLYLTVTRACLFWRLRSGRSSGSGPEDEFTFPATLAAEALPTRSLAISGLDWTSDLWREEAACECVCECLCLCVCVCLCLCVCVCVCEWACWRQTAGRSDWLRRSWSPVDGRLPWWRLVQAFSQRVEKSSSNWHDETTTWVPIVYKTIKLFVNTINK